MTSPLEVISGAPPCQPPAPPPPPPLRRKGHTVAQKPLLVLLFLLLATGTQMLLAMYGLLARYAQIKPVQPVPALRLVVITNLIGEAAMVAFHLLPKLLRRLWRHSRQHQPLPLHTPPGGAGATRDKTGSKGAEPRPAKQHKLGDGGACSSKPVTAAAAAAAAAAGAVARPLPAAAVSTLRPPIPLMRGLSSRMDVWEAQRPALRRRIALCAITAGFTGTCSLHILAPGFVDVSIVQLCSQWTPLLIALVQAVLLRVPLPQAFYFACPAMLAGACMIIVPAVGQNVTGSLNTLRGWCGFVMSVVQLLSTVFYYTMLQATRHFGFSALQLQHYMNCTSVLFFLCLSLPIDGASWGPQFAGWGATDWVALVGLSTVAYLGSGMCMQVCVWKLGAPTAAMFFGLRLVFSVILSTPILGSTIIQTGVQIAGVVITALAVTGYAFSQWWRSRQQHAGQQQQMQQQQQRDSQASLADAASKDGSNGGSKAVPAEPQAQQQPQQQSPPQQPQQQEPSPQPPQQQQEPH